VFIKILALIYDRWYLLEYIILFLHIMLIEEEEPKVGGDLNPDALDEVFSGEDALIEVDEEIEIFTNPEDDEEADEIDIAFAANDEGYW
jgi:hypothetical protein